MNFYQNPAPTPFVTVGNTGLHQPQLQQSIKSHLSQEQYIAELENRLRALWDKYDGDRNHYMDRIKRLEELVEIGGRMADIGQKIVHQGGEDMYWIRKLEEELTEWATAKTT